VLKEGWLDCIVADLSKGKEVNNLADYILK